MKQIVDRVAEKVIPDGRVNLPLSYEETIIDHMLFENLYDWLYEELADLADPVMEVLDAGTF